MGVVPAELRGLSKKWIWQIWIKEKVTYRPWPALLKESRNRTFVTSPLPTPASGNNSDIESMLDYIRS